MPARAQWPFAESVAGVLAGTTTLPHIQRVAARDPRLIKLVTCNASLHDSVWWEMVSLPKLKSDRMVELCVSRPLPADQVDRATLDPRPTVMKKVVEFQELTGDALERAVTMAQTVDSMSTALALSTGVPVAVAVEHLDAAAPHKRARALMAQMHRMPDADVIARALDPDMPLGTLRWRALPDLVNERRSLTEGLLAAVLAGSRPAREQTVLLTYVAESRFAPADLTDQVRALLGANPTWSRERALLIAAIAGNPSTPLPDVTWALDWLDRMQPHLHKLGSIEQQAIDRVRLVRCELLEQVTGDWDAPDTLGQLHTLDVLEADGVVTSAVRAHGHPRMRPEVTPAPVGHFDPSMNALRPPPVRFNPNAPNAVSPHVAWADDMWTGAAAWLDVQLADADEVTLEMFFTLARDWSGSVTSLVAAATVL